MWVEVGAGLWQSCPCQSWVLVWVRNWWKSSLNVLLTAPRTLQLRDKVSGGIWGRWFGRWNFWDLNLRCSLLCPPFGKKLLSPRWSLQCCQELFELKFCRSIPSVGLLYAPESGISCQGELYLTGTERWQSMTVGRDLCQIVPDCF